MVNTVGAQISTQYLQYWYLDPLGFLCIVDHHDLSHRLSMASCRADRGTANPEHETLQVGTQKAHKHTHSMGISLD